jgi:hypothetical protein
MFRQYVVTFLLFLTASASSWAAAPVPVTDDLGAFDSKGALVGRVVEADFLGRVGVLMKSPLGTPFVVNLGSSGFVSVAQQGALTVFFASSDCTGKPYLGSATGLYSGQGSVLPQAVVASPSASVYLAKGVPISSFSYNSARSYLGCQTISGTESKVVPAISGGRLGGMYSPPFHVQ